MSDEKLIYKQLMACMSDVQAVGKKANNSDEYGAVKYKYRSIDDVMNELHGILVKNKVFFTPEVIDQQRNTLQSKSGGNLNYSVLTIRYTFYAEDGSSLQCTVIGEGMDSGDKASNKAMAVGLKYALTQMLCIPTEDPKDPDAQSHNANANPPPLPPVPPEVAELRSYMLDPNMTDEIKEMCENVLRYGDLPKIKKACKGYRDARASRMPATTDAEAQQAFDMPIDAEPAKHPDLF